jgi:hypothetical protein
MDDTIHQLAAETERLRRDGDQRQASAEDARRATTELEAAWPAAWERARERFNAVSFQLLGRLLVRFDLDEYVREGLAYQAAWQAEKGDRHDLCMEFTILDRACKLARGECGQDGLVDAIRVAVEAEDVAWPDAEQVLRKAMRRGKKIAVAFDGKSSRLLGTQRLLEDRVRLGKDGAFGPLPGEPNPAPPHTLPTRPPGQSVEGFGESVSQAKLSPRELAQKHGVPSESLRKRLDRWRYDHDAGYVEVSNAARNEPKYLYDESAVMPVITQLRARSAG